MEERDLIIKLQGLKTIKPSDAWILSVKKEILGSANPMKEPRYRATFSSALGTIMQRRFAYALASILVIAGGIIGTLEYTFPRGASPASLVAALSPSELALQKKLADFKKKSETLAAIAASGSQIESLPVAVQQTKEAVNDLKETIKKEPELVRSVALDVNNAKTLLDITGSESEGLKASANDLYKTIDEQMIKDLKGASLTPEQEEGLAAIEVSFNKENADYATVLRDILLLNASRDSKKN